MYDSILVPVDGSESSTRALEHGLALGEMSQAQVHLLTAVDKSEAAGLDKLLY
ncbi:universal stress protein [Natrialba sp. PRR66]|uniref:universal stress protein n=1 Tax=Natrialba sp. PRR66 TaxID=3098146 RepID=UPI0034E07D84